MAFAVIMFLALCAYAYIETHLDRIVEEIEIYRLIRKSYEDARHICRNPMQFGYAGYKPGEHR